MSAAVVRQILADAASTVDGVSGKPYYVQETKPGAAFVRRDRTDYPNVLGGVVTWNVVLILPNDMAAAEKFLDDKQEPLYAALAEEMAMRSVVPQQLNINGVGTLLCAFFTGQREE